jgi:hypothetical protein
MSGLTRLRIQERIPGIWKSVNGSIGTGKKNWINEPIPVDCFIGSGPERMRARKGGFKVCIICGPALLPFPTVVKLNANT